MPRYSNLSEVSAEELLKHGYGKYVESGGKVGRVGTVSRGRVSRGTVPLGDIVSVRPIPREDLVEYVTRIYPNPLAIPQDILEANGLQVTISRVEPTTEIPPEAEAVSEEGVVATPRRTRTGRPRVETVEPGPVVVPPAPTPPPVVVPAPPVVEIPAPPVVPVTVTTPSAAEARATRTDILSKRLGLTIPPESPLALLAETQDDFEHAFDTIDRMRHTIGALVGVIPRGAEGIPYQRVLAGILSHGRLRERILEGATGVQLAYANMNRPNNVATFLARIQECSVYETESEFQSVMREQVNRRITQDLGYSLDDLLSRRNLIAVHADEIVATAARGVEVYRTHLQSMTNNDIKKMVGDRYPHRKRKHPEDERRDEIKRVEDYITGARGILGDGYLVGEIDPALTLVQQLTAEIQKRGAGFLTAAAPVAPPMPAPRPVIPTPPAPAPPQAVIPTPPVPRRPAAPPTVTAPPRPKPAAPPARPAQPPAAKSAPPRPAAPPLVHRPPPEFVRLPDFTADNVNEIAGILSRQAQFDGLSVGEIRSALTAGLADDKALPLVMGELSAAAMSKPKEVTTPAPTAEGERPRPAHVPTRTEAVPAPTPARTGWEGRITDMRAGITPMDLFRKRNIPLTTVGRRVVETLHGSPREVVTEGLVVVDWAGAIRQEGKEAAEDFMDALDERGLRLIETGITRENMLEVGRHIAVAEEVSIKWRKIGLEEGQVGRLKSTIRDLNGVEVECPPEIAAEYEEVKGRFAEIADAII